MAGMAGVLQPRAAFLCWIARVDDHQLLFWAKDRRTVLMA